LSRSQDLEEDFRVPDTVVEVHEQNDMYEGQRRFARLCVERERGREEVVIAHSEEGQ
jgi:hypothetical protein